MRASIEIEPHIAIGIGVDDVVNLRADLGFHAEFLHQLAMQRGLQLLARIDLAAGKFPVAAERVVRQPLRDEQPARRRGG